MGVRVVRPEGENQLLCHCPWCDSDKMYVNTISGLWDCKKGCGSGNLPQLAEKLPGCDSKAIKDRLTEWSGKQEARSSSQQQPVKLALTKGMVRPMDDDEYKAFCKVKDVNQNALSTMISKPTLWRLKAKPHAILFAYNPSSPMKACGAMQIHMEGKLIKTKNGEEKYPLIFGSKHGLLGVAWIAGARPKPDTLLFMEGWRDAVAAVENGYFATASSGGASCFKDEWLPLFKGKKVYIIMDADKAGVHQAERAAGRIVTVASEVLITTLPYKVKAKDGKDYVDFCDENKEKKTKTKT